MQYVRGIGSDCVDHITTMIFSEKKERSVYRYRCKQIEESIKIVKLTYLNFHLSQFLQWFTIFFKEDLIGPLLTIWPR